MSISSLTIYKDFAMMIIVYQATIKFQGINEEEICMEQLTFGEQLKIVLSRKGMTIKELAELMEEKTGKKMSRQNMTQRIGRDNFQEQDMRLIASILECNFSLNILSSTESAFTSNVHVMQPVKEQPQRPIFKVVEKVDKPTIEPEVKEAAEVEEVAEVEEAAKVEEPAKLEESVEDKVVVEDAIEAKFEELELDEVELEEIELEEKPAEKPVESEVFVIDEEEEFEIDESAGGDITIGELQDMGRELTDVEKEAVFRERGVFLRVNGVPVPPKEDESSDEEADKKFEPVKPKVEYKEDLTEQRSLEELRKIEEAGGIDPTTGKEYETNTVKGHPTRIGYVQVYDRAIGRWKDMTEWAFIGYQERKKAVLGSSYEPPIYLD